MKKRILALLLLTALTCTVLGGCGDSSQQADASGANQSGGSSGAVPADQDSRPGVESVTVAIAQDLDQSLDPHRMVLAGTKEVLFNVFEGLMKPTPEGDLIPAVAADHSVSGDGRTYTFPLRQGVKFHNGADVTAEDVVWSIERCAGAEEGKAPLVPAFSNIDSVSSPDEKTVTITLKEPDSDFLSYLTTAILPRDYDQQDTAPVGTGPFKFVSRTPQESVVLERFDEYWGTPAYLGKVTFKIIENADALVQALQSGAVDLCAHLTATQVAQLGGKFTILEGTMNLVQAMYLNNAAAPLDNEKVRQALCHAVDKQEIMDFIADGHGKAIGSSMYPTFGKYFDDSLTNYYTKDVEKARSLLAEAGYPDGFELTVTVPSNYQPHIDTAEVLAEQLKAVGVTAKIDLVDMNTWREKAYVGREFQATVVGVDASNMTARALLERFTSDHAKNFINYNSPAYDELFRQALSEQDDARRTELYKAMERDLAEHAANVYIQDLADLVAIRPDLTGYEFYPIYVMDLSTVKAA